MSDASTWPGVVDLQFLGRAGRIAAGAIRHARRACWLSIPGRPAACRVSSAGWPDSASRRATFTGCCSPTSISTTAGAAGTLVRQHPHVKVYVHARGAPHLVDPAKLLASAARLYGDQMDRLWGEFAAVPAADHRGAR